MKLSVLLVALIGLVLAALAVRVSLAKASHDPVEYYMGWRGYRHPITPEHRITKEEADALTARGAAYLIGHYDGDGKLTGVVRLYRGKFFFEYLYAYHPNGIAARPHHPRRPGQSAGIRRARPPGFRRRHRVLRFLAAA
jgi:hypothetical protein